MTAAAERATLTSGVTVQIVAGRFAGMSGRLTEPGSERTVVDLGVPIDGGSGLVSVPVSAVREVER